MPRGSNNPDQTEFNLFDEPAPATNKITRYFLGWDRPVLSTVAEYLLDSASGDRVIDLSSHLIIVPTRHAGRRLRETLALEAAKHEAAVFPPLVVTQDYLAASDRIPQGKPVADREATRLIWAALLLDLNLERFRYVFPVDPIKRDLTWAMKTADELLDVRNLLTESGFTFATVSEPLREQDMEPLRWKELAELEAIAITRPEDLGLRDDTLSRIEAAKTGVLPPDITTILVAGTPDLQPLTVAALELAANQIPVEIMVHAPESEANLFDTWGRPLAKLWLEREIEIPDAAHSIRAAASPALVAELACDLIGDEKEPAAVAAIGVPDTETISCLEQSAAKRGWTTYDPAGQPVSRHGIYYLLDQTAALLATQSFEAVTRLLRCPDFTRALVAKLPTSTESEPNLNTATAFIAKIDKLRESSLPDQLEDAIAAAQRHSSAESKTGNPVQTGLQWIADWLQRFRKEPFGTVLIDYLSEIFADRTFDAQETAHGAFAEVATAILEAEAAFEATRKAFTKPPQPSDRFHLLLELIRQRHLYDEREPDHIDLEGWLELLWEDAPHLVVTGMNDHVVPEAIIGHAFLPDSARQALGIPDNNARFARDAYLLTSLIETRRTSGGRIDLLFARQSESGDPLRPSRLLFQCSDDELPERTLQFFGGEAAASQPLPWALPWKLKPLALPDDAKIFQRLSVTQFKGYLTCPFRFYLQHGLRMEEIDAEKAEMDARDFGNLIHNALDRFALDPEASTSSSPKVIRDSLENQIDALLFRNYGSQLSTPVLIQREAARRRLGWWAEIEAQERADGWRILETETKLSSDDHPFALAGHEISGRIDRIEEHEDGRLRVFDFKTHAVYDSTKYRNKTVGEYHIAPIKRTEDAEIFPDWSLVDNEDGKPARWVDLQIPIYLLALAKRFPDREITAGHIALGPTQNEIVLDLWDSLDADLLASAKTCAKGVIQAVKEKKFWPPTDRLPWSDPFEELLFWDARESVDFALEEIQPR